MAADITKSDFVFEDWEGEELITITPLEYASKNPITKDIYITIGEDSTTFSLQTYFTNT